MLSFRPLTKHEERRRTVKAVELAAEGWSYPEIAIQLGYKDEAGPRMAVLRHLRRRAKTASDVVFHQMIDRLDRALMAIMPLVDDGDLKAIETMLRLDNQRAKLYGIEKGAALDADKAEGDEKRSKVKYDDKESARILKLLAETGGLAELLPEGVPAAALFLPDGVIYDDSDIPESEEDPGVIEELAADFRAEVLGQPIEVEVLMPGQKW